MEGGCQGSWGCSRLSRDWVLSGISTLEQIVLIQTKTIPAEIFSDIVQSGCRKHCLLKNGIGAESGYGSMAGTFCSCRRGSTGHTGAALPCHFLLLLWLMGEIWVQQPSGHQCRSREPCSSVRGEAEAWQRWSHRQSWSWHCSAGLARLPREILVGTETPWGVETLRGCVCG